MQGVLLRTHERDPMLSAPGHHTLQPATEALRSCEFGIAHTLAIVELALTRARPKLLSEKDVVNSRIAQRGCEPLTVELRIEPAERHGAHIGERANVMLPQQLDKALGRVF